jgi:hypothetical protein
MACGHNTCAADAEDFIIDVDASLLRAMENLVQERVVEDGRVAYTREDRKINFLGPRERFEELKNDEGAMKRLRERQSKK